MPKLNLHVEAQIWPLRQTFTISRGSKDHVAVVSVTLDDGTRKGRGECVPYAHNDETVEGVIKLIKSLEGDFQNGLDRLSLQNRLPPGAARNALDCALWDLEAARLETPVWKLAGLPEPAPALTAYTISLDTPQNMAKTARDASRYPLLKLKLGGSGDTARLKAVRCAVPKARLIADANEAWTADNFTKLMSACAKTGVELIEQPLPASQDECLSGFERPVRVCADESVHTCKDLDRLRPFYDMVNIKLDKTGGLTGAIALARKADAMGFELMIGCMMATSLSMAPAALLAPLASYIDLDAPLLLSRDQPQPLKYDGAYLLPPASRLWGC